MKERQEEALRAAAAEFLNREANRTSMITVTRTELSNDGKRAIIYLSVFPESGEEPAVKFANRNRGEFGVFLLKQVRGLRVPHVDFQIDMGEKHRRRLDELSN